MRLTRRGYGVVGVVVLAELLAFGFGASALNAFAAPALVALFGGVVQLWLAEAPSATRTPVPRGFPGDTHETHVEVGGRGVATVRQPVPEGLVADDAPVELSLPGSFALSLQYSRRGTHTLGPLEVTVTDLLGLVRRHHRVGGEMEVTVYPTVYQLAGQGQFLETALESRGVERQEFDSLREYVPGDPLRDVHWKTSAKDPGALFVKEFVDRTVDEDVVIVATSEPDPGAGDAMATAAASVATTALEAGLGVALHTGQVTVPMGRGEDHRTALFEALADVPAGTRVDGDPEGDIYVHADASGVEISFGSRTRSLEELTVSRDNPLATGGASA